MNGPETFVPRNSSHIEQADYDPETDTLTITFTGGEAYDYLNVPPSTYRAFTAAPSAGEFFHRHIKGRFGYDGPK